MRKVQRHREGADTMSDAIKALETAYLEAMREAFEALRTACLEADKAGQCASH